LDRSRRGDRGLHFHMVSRFKVQSYTPLISSDRQEVSDLQSFGSCDDFLCVRFRHCYLGLTKHKDDTASQAKNGNFFAALLLLTSLVLKTELCRCPMHACKKGALIIWNAAYMSQNAYSRPRVGAAAYSGIRFLHWPAIGSRVNAKATLHLAIRAKRYWSVRSSVTFEIAMMQEEHENHMILESPT
jgi:hypothetical protein